MYSFFRWGKVDDSLLARSRPFISGITTSVMSK
jgi:hypothetical protein